jgi:predicted dehydrogenase
MTMVKTQFKVAILGLGRVGSTFLSKLSTIDNIGVDIVAAVERDTKAAGLSIAQSSDIPVYTDAREVVKLGEDVDIIFDLTGNPETRKVMRADFARSGNQHTVLVTEVMAQFIWSLMDDVGGFPNFHADKGY